MIDPLYGQLTLKRNVDVIWPQQWVHGGSNAPYDFTGSTFELVIKSALGKAAPVVLSLTSGNGAITAVDLSIAKLQVRFSRETIDAGSYFFDQVRVNGGDRELMAYGPVLIEEGVGYAP